MIISKILPTSSKGATQVKCQLLNHDIFLKNSQQISRYDNYPQWRQTGLRITSADGAGCNDVENFGE